MDVFMGCILPFGFDYAPQNWAQCNGQLLTITQNSALYSLIGTRYGGNGVQNFGLPNLQGRTMMHTGSGYAMGQAGGGQATLATANLPSHNHSLMASQSNAGSAAPTGVLAAAIGLDSATGDAITVSVYGPATNTVALDPGSISFIGGGTPFATLPPFQVVNMCIALSGIWPTRP